MLAALESDLDSLLFDPLLQDLPIVLAETRSEFQARTIEELEVLEQQLDKAHALLGADAQLPTEEGVPPAAA